MDRQSLEQYINIPKSGASRGNADDEATRNSTSVGEMNLATNRRAYNSSRMTAEQLQHVIDDTDMLWASEAKSVSRQ